MRQHKGGGALTGLNPNPQGSCMSRAVNTAARYADITFRSGSSESCAKCPKATSAACNAAYAFASDLKKARPEVKSYARIRLLPQQLGDRCISASC